MLILSIALLTGCGGRPASASDPTPTGLSAPAAPALAPTNTVQPPMVLFVTPPPVRAEEPLSPDSRNIPSVFAGINEYYAVQATLTSVDQPPPPAADPAIAARAVVQIRRCDAFGCETPAGSGVFIHPSGLILTAYHVLLTDAEDPNATRYPDFVIAMTENPRTAPQPRYRARLVASKADQDLALLAIDRTLETAALDGNPLSLPALPLVDVTTLFADDLHVLGYPVNGGEAISYVRTGFRSFDDNGRLIVVDQALDPGNSGGPALVMREGRLAIAGLVIRRRSTQGQLSQQGLVRAIDQLDTLTWTPRVPRAWGENLQAQMQGSAAAASLQLALTLNTVDLVGQPLRLLFYATDATTEQPWRPVGMNGPLVVWADVDPLQVIARQRLTLTVPTESLGAMPDRLRFRALLWNRDEGEPLWADAAGVQAALPTSIPEPTATATLQPTPTPLPTATATMTLTPLPPTPTFTATQTPEPTVTATLEPTPLPTASATMPDTPLLPTPTFTDTPTLEPTATATLEPTPTPLPTATVTATDTPLPPTPTFTATPVPQPPRVRVNANLRSGPGTNFPVTGGTVTGQEITIVARNEDASWFQLDNGGWVAAFLVVNAPNADDVPFFQAKSYFDSGVAYRNQGQYEQAIADYNKAIELDPAYARAYVNRGLAYADQEQYEQAIADYNKAIELDPAYATAYNNRGFAYADQGQYEQAIADYNKAIELNHDPLSWPYNNRGVAYADQEQYEQAIADYNKAIELDPAYATAYNNRGFAYADQEQYEQAFADYNKAIELNPTYALAYVNRGFAYADQEQYEQAFADYRRSTELAPDDPDGWNAVCWWGSLTGIAADVLAACEQAVHLSDSAPPILDSRGLARALTGDSEGAIADFTAYVQWSKENDAYELYGKKREVWIAALQRGENPFDEATLAALRKE